MILLIRLLLPKIKNPDLIAEEFDVVLWENLAVEEGFYFIVVLESLVSGENF